MALSMGRLVAIKYIVATRSAIGILQQINDSLLSGHEFVPLFRRLLCLESYMANCQSGRSSDTLKFFISHIQYINMFWSTSSILISHSASTRSQCNGDFTDKSMDDPRSTMEQACPRTMAEMRLAIFSSPSRRCLPIAFRCHEDTR